MLECRHKYCCAPDLDGGHIGKIMNNRQPFSSSKECDLRRSAMLQAGGRSSSRALDRIAVASTVRHGAAMTQSSDTPFAGSAYDRLDYDTLDEDTIEIVLSPEDMQLLSRAADEALAEAKATREMAATLVASLGPTEANATTPWPPAAISAAAITPTVAPAAADSASATAARPTAKTASPPKASVAAKPAGAATLPTVNPPALTSASVAAKPAGAAAAPPTAKPSVTTGTPAAANLTNAAAAPSTAKLSATTAAPAATKAPIPMAARQANKPSAVAPVPAAATPATATVIPVLSAADPSNVTAAPPPKTPAKTKERVLPARRPAIAGASLRQAIARLPLGVMGIVGVAAVTAVAIASIAHHSRHEAALVPEQASTTAPPTPELASTNPATETATAPDPGAVTDAAQPKPVRVKNPFDHSEVFEFPPGTSLKEARQSMAQILMQRAHDRGVPTFHAARPDRHPVARSKPSNPSEPVGLVQNSR